MNEIAVFRHINRGTPSHYITVAKKYIPETWRRVTITIAIPDGWKTGKLLYGHLAKELGKATIHNSYKIVINKTLLEQLSALEYRKPVWVRVIEYTPNPPPPPPTPYIQKPITVHCDGSSYFFTMSARTVDYLRELSPGRNLKVTVYLGNNPITYVKKPTRIDSETAEQMYKILLPASIFNELVKSGMTVHVRVETTNEPET